MNVLIVDHNSKVKAVTTEPRIVAIQLRTATGRNNFVTGYSLYKTEEGVYRGLTLAVEQKLAQLSSTKISDWNIAVQVHFKEGTPTYRSIFPRGLSGIYQQTIDGTVVELRALGQRMEPFATLDATRTEVETFADELETLRDTQQQQEGIFEGSADALETLRLAAGNIMYANTGILMDVYFENPEEIERFFELSLIRDTGSGEGNSDHFEGEVAGGETKNITSDEVKDGNVVRFTNTGTVSLTFFYGLLPTDTSGLPSVTVAAGATETITLGPVDPARRFLNVTNLSTETGSYEVAVETA